MPALRGSTATPSVVFMTRGLEAMVGMETGGPAVFGMTDSNARIWQTMNRRRDEWEWQWVASGSKLELWEGDGWNH